MLKVMRESFHRLKWILIAVVAAFVFGFVFIDMGLGGGGVGGGATDRAFAARVNGETITYNDYYRALKRVEDMYRQMYGQQFTPEMAAMMGLQKQVIDSLVDAKLLQQEAERLELTASPEEVRAQLLESPTFTQNGKFIGMELYQRYVTGPLGYNSVAEFENDIARDLSLQKIESALRNSIVVSAAQADDEYRRSAENARIRYVLLSSTDRIASTTVTPAELESYYNANKPKYAHGEQRSVRYLLADVARIRTQLKPSDAELRQVYEANKQSFTRPASARVLHILVKVDPQAPAGADAIAKAKAESLVQQLRAGGDFAAIARANSQDPSSSANGGDMGFVEMGQTVEPFERAIFSIPLNTISDPIRTQEYGYHIVKVTERRDAGTRSFEEVRPELIARAAGELAQTAARNEINRINALLRQKKPANVQEFVALANDKVTSNDSGWFGRNEPVAGLGVQPALSEWVFKSKKGDISDPIETPRGLAIAYVADSRDAGVPTLEEIRPRVESELKRQKAGEAARAELARRMAGAASIDQVAAAARATAVEATASRAAGVEGIAGESTAVADAALAANVGELKGPITVRDGAVAFQVVSQKKVTPQELEQNRTAAVDRLRNEQTRMIRAALLEKLRKNAEVEISDEITRPTVTPAGI